MKTVLISAICLFAATTVAAQTVIIDGVPRDTSFTLDGTYKKERKYRPYIEPVRASLPQGVRAYEDVTYKKVSNSLGEHALKMNIYRPDDNKKYPVLLMIHGGGWNLGQPRVAGAHGPADSRPRICCHFLSNYRLIPEAL